MQQVLWSCVLLCLVACCQGLDFTVTDVDPADPDSRHFTALVTCEVDITPPAPLTSPDDQTDSVVHLKNISSMSVFRSLLASAGLHGNQQREVLVASVTSGDYVVKRLTNETRVDASLEAGRRAAVQVALARHQDLHAEYTCQVRGFDTHGREVVTSAKLIRQPDQKLKEKDDLMTAVSAQLRASVGQAVTQLMKGMENKIESMEQSLGQSVTLFQEEFKNRSGALEQRLDSVQSFVESVRNATAARPQLALTTDTDRQLDLTSRNDSSVSRHELQSLLTVSESRRSRELKAMLANFVASNACEKGMRAFLSPTFPYPVTFPKNTLDFSYPCDAVTDGGGWIILQRRSAGNTDFNRSFADYKQGFGSFDADFWLGNDKIYTITSTGTYELRIDLRYNGTSAYAHYSLFSIAAENYVESSGRNRYSYYDSAAKGYMLSLGAYSGTAGDSLRESDGQAFSTADTDRDASSGNCAEEYGGGWWFVGCGYTCLNGRWGRDRNKGAEWRDLTGGQSVSFSEMKIRRVS